VAHRIDRRRLWHAIDNETGAGVLLSLDWFPPPQWFRLRAAGERQLTQLMAHPPREGFALFDDEGRLSWKTSAKVTGEAKQRTGADK